MHTAVGCAGMGVGMFNAGTVLIKGTVLDYSTGPVALSVPRVV